VLYKKGDDIVLPAGTTINLVLEEAVSVTYQFTPAAQAAATAEPLVTAESAEGADVDVLLRNGNSERGEFLGITDGSKIQISLAYGTMEIPLADVAELIFAEGGATTLASSTSDTFYLINGRVLLGGFLGYENNTFIVGTDYGELRIPVTDVARIVLVQ
jgi:hypothetical protein